jgi:hypothetical protein
MKGRAYLPILISIGIFLWLYFNSNLNGSECFILAFQALVFTQFVNNFGYTICYFDFLCFYAVFDTLTTAVIGYRIFNVSNEYASMFGTYMRVPEETYYSFMIPANVALYLGVNRYHKKIESLKIKEYVKSLDRKLADKGKVGIILIVVGFLSSIIFPYVPGPLEFVFFLFSMLKFVGPLYLYFSDFSQRKLILYLSIAVFFIQSVVAGLWGEFAMYTALLLIIVSLKSDFKFLPKLFVICSAIFLVMVLQAVKPVYRKVTWQGRATEGLSSKNTSNLEIFSTLFWDRITNPEKVTDERVLFQIYRRMNQGYLLSREMNYIPRVEPYANGETIYRTVIAILVPRVLWPDKPEAGGRYNLSRFLGIKQRLAYSMNIGPFGEAYGNFGPFWGVFFIFLYGVFLAFLMKTSLTMSMKNPSLLLWLPLLFYFTLTVETDILTAVNSFIKGFLFVWVLFFLSRRFFNSAL